MIRVGAFILLLLVFVAFFSFSSPHFLTLQNIQAVFRHMSSEALAALGLTFVVVVRKADLSFPGVASLGAMTTGWFIAHDQGLVLAIAAGIAVGLVFGCFSGFAAGFLGYPDIVSTIALGSIAFGLSYLYSGGMTISDNFMTSGLLDINDIRILFLPGPVIIMAVCYAFAAVLLHWSRFGREFYATGENPVCAFFSGVRLRNYIFIAFALCGAFACVASILHCAEAGQADVKAGSGFLMPAYASVFLGAALFGGASVPATFAGSLLIQTMLNGLNLLNVPYYYSGGAISLVLIVAIAIFDARVGAFLRALWPGLSWRSNAP